MSLELAREAAHFAAAALKWQTVAEVCMRYVPAVIQERCWHDIEAALDKLRTEVEVDVKAKVLQ
jgi:hypothetical protein